MTAFIFSATWCKNWCAFGCGHTTSTSATWWKAPDTSAHLSQRGSRLSRACADTPSGYAVPTYCVDRSWRRRKDSRHAKLSYQLIRSQRSFCVTTKVTLPPMKNRRITKPTIPRPAAIVSISALNRVNPASAACWMARLCLLSLNTLKSFTTVVVLTIDWRADSDKWKPLGIGDGSKDSKS